MYNYFTDLFDDLYENVKESMTVDGEIERYHRFARLYDIVDENLKNLDNANAEDKLDNDSYNIMYGIIWTLYATSFVAKPEFESMLHCLRYYKEQIDGQ